MGDNLQWNQYVLDPGGVGGLGWRWWWAWWLLVVLLVLYATRY